jgi:hypothetical protein
MQWNVTFFVGNSKSPVDLMISCLAQSHSVLLTI